MTGSQVVVTGGKRLGHDVFLDSTMYFIHVQKSHCIIIHRRKWHQEFLENQRWRVWLPSRLLQDGPPWKAEQ